MFNVYSVKAVSKNEEFALGTETALIQVILEMEHTYKEMINECLSMPTKLYRLNEWTKL